MEPRRIYCIRRLTLVALAAIVLLAPVAAHATEIKISSGALERTLNKQLFTSPGNRYYLKGKPEGGCFVYAEDPKITFKDDHIWIHIKTHSKLGTTVHGACLGVDINAEADVSVIPEAQGENIGFRDARIEHLSTSRELNVFLVPFLNGKLPQQMKINVADLIRQLLTKSMESTGYNIALDNLKVHSMQVDHTDLDVDFDANLSVQ
jgi:uncharacterized lipoprotein YajG